MNEDLIQNTLNWLKGEKAVPIRLSQNSEDVPYARQHVNPDHLDRFTIEPTEKDEPHGQRQLRYGKREIGSTHHSPPGRIENSAARNMFPELGINENDPVHRINSIHLDEDWRGTRLGRHMILDMLNQSKPNSWFYNSQMSHQATAALEKLKDDGMIELHWKKHPLGGYEQLGGINISRITDKGRDVLKNKNLLDNRGMKTALRDDYLKRKEKRKQ